MDQVPIIRKSDSRKGIVAAILFLLIAFFLLFFITYSEPDPPKETVLIPIILGEVGISNFEINNGGGGAPSENTDPVPNPEENPQEQPTQAESPVTVPTGTGDTKTDNATATPEPAAPNPFSGNGTGGTGTKGSGGGFGNDTGPGSGSGDPGKGTEGARVRLANIHSKPETHSYECYIAFNLTVDSQGKVLRADFIRDKSTTTDQKLIDEVIELVKKEVRYKKRPGARNEVVYYRAKVTPK